MTTRSTEANTEQPDRRWYERGYGPRWRVKSGAVHGRKTSQMLGGAGPSGRWGDERVVGNNVSYAPFVQDEGDRRASTGDAAGDGGSRWRSRRPSGVRRLLRTIRKLIGG